jgi:predicted methyltransferase
VDKPFLTGFTALAATALASCPAALAAQEPASTDIAANDIAASAIAAAVANPARPEADRARDAARKPAEIVAFAGVKPGDLVAEIAPGGGYYTRLLAKTVGPTGHVYALMPGFFANRPGGLDAINALAAEYGNVTVVVADFTAFSLDRAVDLVWTTENYHDLANGNIAGANQSVFTALKPGGIYFVEDHSAPGTGVTVTSTLHRIDPAAVKEQVAAAGFTLEAESDLLHNPADPHNVGVRDPSLVGGSDKFALRFRKPG